MEKILEPSLLSLDKNNALYQIEQIRDLKLKYVHYDVMDQGFIGHTALSTEYLDILEKTNILPNVHLMVSDPERYIDLYQGYKLNSITFHVETQDVREAKRLLDKIHKLGFKAGVAIKMETDLHDYISLAPNCDFILIMAVNPGAAGQRYSEACWHNLNVAKMMKSANPNIRIQLDGGVDDTIITKHLNDVDNFISGSWFFKNINHMKQYINLLKKGA